MMRLPATLAALLITAALTRAQDNIILRTGEEIPAKVLEVNQADLKYRKSANPEGPVYTAPLRDVLLIKYANGTKDSFGAGRPPLPGRPGQPMLPEARTMVGLGPLRYHRSLFSRYYTSADGQRMRIAQTWSILYSQPDAMTSFERGRSLRTWSIVTAVPAVALMGAGVGLLIAGDGRGGRDRNDRSGLFSGRDNDPDGSGTTTTNNGRSGRGDEVVAGAVLAGSGLLLGAASLWLDHRATVQFRRAADRYNTRPSTSFRFRPSRQGLGAGAALIF